MEKYTPAQVAEMIGFHPRTVQLYVKRWKEDLIKAGVLQIGGGVHLRRYYIVDLDKFFEVLEEKGLILVPDRKK